MTKTMKYKHASLLAALLIFTSSASVRADSEQQYLNNELNQVDTTSGWQQTERQERSFDYQHPDYGASRYIPLRPGNAAMGMPYLRPPSQQAIAQAERVYRRMTQSMGPTVDPGGSNPFNLSPIGMLHYMLDDRTYVSNANPVALYGVQSDLQVARQDSAMAQSAAKRARYAADPQERQQAASQARYYAEQAQAAARRAQELAEAGSNDPASVAALAAQEAQAATEAAGQASYGSGF